MKNIFLIFALMITCLFIKAQAPQSFNYQAVVRNAEGITITNQPIAAKISIISNNINGTTIYTETHSVNTNNIGLINLTVGTGNVSLGSFDNINWANDLYFIKIEIDPNGENNYQISGVSQLLSVPYAMYAQKAGNVNLSDTSATNELQTISILGNDLSISNGNTVTLPIVTYIGGTGIDISGNTISSNIVGNATHTGDATGSGALTVVAIRGRAISTTTPTANQFLKWNSTLSQWEPSTINQSNWITNGNNIYNSNTGNIGIGTSTPNSKLEVKGSGDTLFQVKDASGNPVFIVFPEGVQVYVKEGATKGNIGGFAVSGRSASKGITGEYLKITPDSARIYIKENTSNKGNIGGFAVSGRSASKGLKNYFNISVDTTGLINPSQARILWYPTKSAFLTGQVLIQHKDSVGKNSFASGYESKAIGDYSQALGYKAVARKAYSTAIGNYAIANGYSSFAFGEGATAFGNNSFAFGSNAKAIGIGSFAFGSQGRDSLGNITSDYTVTSGQYSIAIGQGAKSTNMAAFSIGINSEALADFSFATGFKTMATSYGMIAMGRYNYYSLAWNKTAWVSSEPLLVIGNGNSTYRSNALTILKNGNMGIEANNPSYDLSFGNLFGGTKLIREIGVERNASGIAGYNLKNGGTGLHIIAGGCTSFSTATNASGGALVLQSGISKGNAGSSIVFSTATPGASGSTDNNPDEKMRINGYGYVGINNTSPNSTLHVSGSIAANIITVSGINDLTLDATHHTVLVNLVVGSEKYIYLPPASSANGRIYIIKKISDGLAYVYIKASGTETIDGVNQRSITGYWSVIVIQSNGTNWYIIN